MADDQETIFVRSTLPKASDGGDPVVLFETDDRHPSGQAFIAGDLPVEVADTPAVRYQIREGRLEELSHGDAQNVLQERKRLLIVQLERDIAASKPETLLELLRRDVQPVTDTAPRAQSQPGVTKEQTKGK